jgi:hypothetical protein
MIFAGTCRRYVADKQMRVRREHAASQRALSTLGVSENGGVPMVESISAVTLATHEMARSVAFYRTLGFEVVHGGENAAFATFRVGASYLNLIAQPIARRWAWWGRVIFYERTSTVFMPARLPPDSSRKAPHVMPSGESVSSTSSIQMAMS